MNEDQYRGPSSLPSAQPSRPSHLSGDALKQWYLDNPPLTEEDRQRAIKRERDKQEATAWVWLMSLGLLVAVCHAAGPFSPPAFFLGPLTASVIGVWLAIGRSNLLVRSLIALVLVISFGWAFTPYRSVLMACTLCSATASYAALWLMTWFFRTGTRRLRFTILDIGGAILLVGCGLGLIQAEAYDTMAPWEWNRFKTNMHLSVYFSGNTVLASLPMMVPRCERGSRLFRLSAAWVLGITPIMECFLLTQRSTFVLTLLGLPFLWVAHVIGAAFVWGLIYPLEVVGAFRDEADPPITTTESAAGHWEEME